MCRCCRKERAMSSRRFCDLCGSECGAWDPPIEFVEKASSATILLNMERPVALKGRVFEDLCADCVAYVLAPTLRLFWKRADARLVNA